MNIVQVKCSELFKVVPKMKYARTKMNYARARRTCKAKVLLIKASRRHRLCSGLL